MHAQIVSGGDRDRDREREREREREMLHAVSTVYKY